MSWAESRDNRSEGDTQSYTRTYRECFLATASRMRPFAFIFAYMRFIYTKTFAIFAACVAILALLMFFQTKGWLDSFRITALQAPRPVVAVAQAITLPVKTFFSTIYQLGKISRENSRLRAQVISLQQNLVQYQEEAGENQALRTELGFVKTAKQALVACTVLSTNPFGYSDSVILNCGSGDGVSEGQAVIAQGYLVGKIIYAGNSSSVALLATDPDFSVDATVSQTAVHGIVRGSFGSGMVLEQVPQNSDLQSGWLAVTAGINPQVPKKYFNRASW